MLGNRQNIPRFQSVFYRDSYHKVLRWLLISIVIMLLCILVIIYFELFAPKAKYYASTTTGQIIELTTLN